MQMSKVECAYLQTGAEVRADRRNLSRTGTITHSMTIVNYVNCNDDRNHKK